MKKTKMKILVPFSVGRTVAWGKMELDKKRFNFLKFMSEGAMADIGVFYKKMIQDTESEIEDLQKEIKG